MILIDLISKLKSQAGQSAIYKGLTGVFLFLNISILVRYLGDDGYGIWVLVYGFFQWGLYLDLGISNVLKTKIPEFSSKNLTHKINSYISQSFKVTIVIATILLLVCTIFIWFFNLNELFKINDNESFIKLIFFLNAFFFCVNFILSINKSFFIGVLQPKVSEKIATINQFLFLACVVIFFLVDAFTFKEKLIYITIANGVINIFVNGYFTTKFFRKYPYKFNWKDKDRNDDVRDIIKNGSQFMLIQVFMVIIFFSDPYLIARYCGPSEVSEYDVLNKLYQMPLLVTSSALASMWPFFTQKYVEKDFKWFKRTFNDFNKYFLLIVLGVLIFSFVSKYILNLWIGDELSSQISFYLLGIMALFVLFRIYFTFFANFFNGINQLKSQIYVMGITAVIKIPLTIFILQKGYGVSGVIFLLAVFMLIWSIYFKFAAIKEVKKIF